MSSLPNDGRAGGICGQSCRLRLDGLFGSPFAAPGAFAILRCTNCGQKG